MQHYTAERIIKTKYKKTKVVNYRQQNDNLNILETCTFLDCNQYIEQIMMDILILQDENEC